ncbi:MAG: TlpA disulfide reductase family protein [Thermoguttaceae bacterium]
MRRIGPTVCGFVVLSAALWAMIAVAQQTPSRGQPAANPPATKQPGEKSKVAEPAAEKADPYVVPEGTPKEMAAYIRRIAPLPVRDFTALEKKRKAILQAAEKILAGKADDADLELGVQAKMSMLDDSKQLAAFIDELKKTGRPRLARMASRFSVARELGMAAEQFETEARMKSPSDKSREQVKTAVQNVVKYLQEATPELDDARLADLSGQAAELIGDNALAIATYEAVAKAFAANKDARLAEFTKHMQGIARRLGLVGNPMEIDGKLLDGKPFDWSKYKGRVVLVDFWATWCGACVAEMPELQRYYDFYHAKGFDIIGISGDRRLADLDRFVKDKKVPWPIVFNGEHPSPAISYYGIQHLPTMILVGKDGKVLASDIDGFELKRWLAKLLGPMPATEKEASKGAASLEPRQPAKK